MGLVAEDVLRLLLLGEQSGEPTSRTAKKIARHLLEAYAGRVTWVLDQIGERIHPLDFDGDLVAHQRFKAVLRKARRAVEAWRRNEINNIEEGA